MGEWEAGIWTLEDFNCEREEDSWLAGSRGIAAEMNVRQAYTVKLIRKGLTPLGPIL